MAVYDAPIIGICEVNVKMRYQQISIEISIFHLPAAYPSGTAARVSGSGVGGSVSGGAAVVMKIGDETASQSPP